MKNLYKLLFVLVLSAATSFMFAATIHSAGTLTGGSVTSAGVATGGGNWSATTTWQEGVVPVAGDEVFILSGDLVKIDVSANALNLTVQTGGSVWQGAGMAGTGTFTLQSGSTWYAAYGSATKLPQGFVTYSIDPNSNWIICSTASSTLINGLPALYGNLTIYKQGSILAGATTITDINIQGNLTIDNSLATSAVKGSNTKSSQVTNIHVGGNVYIKSGILSGVDAVTQTTSCTYNIDGNVYVGDASTTSGQAAFAPVSAADGGYQRTGIFNINGNLSYINGAKLEAGTNATSTNLQESAVINLKGNLLLDGSVVIANNTPGTFVLNFGGTASQTISVGIPLAFTPATLFNLKINNAAGVTANSSIVLTGILNLTSGSLTTSNSTLLTLAPGSTITGESSSSYINGPLAFQFATIGSFANLYPIGKGGTYRPLTLSLTQSAATLSTYTAEMFNAAPNANTLPSTINKISTARYYVISEGSGGSAFTAGSVLLNYDTDDGVSNATNLRIAQGPAAGGGSWVDFGGVGSANTTGTITSASFNNLTNTVFSLANNTGGTNVLPVELSSFSASSIGRSVQINWTTSTEKNCNKFEIERTLVNINGQSAAWVKTGTIQAFGTSILTNKYSYTDNNLQSGKYQYRLKMIDLDGTFEYGKAAETVIALPKDFDLSQNYPNPFNPSTKINYNLPFDAKITMDVYNIKGEKISQLVNEDQYAGYNFVDFNSSSLNRTISSGVYFYRLTAVDKVTGKNFTSIKKMVLLK